MFPPRRSGSGETGRVIDDVLSQLSCPHCATEFTREENTLRCAEGHAFDVARQGYVSLLAGDQHRGTADTAGMVAARAAFLAEGHYAGIAALLADLTAEPLADPPAGTCVVDLGAGTGYYLAAVLDAAARRPGASGMAGIALDVSKHAARHAARAHPRVGAVVADAWQGLPIRGRAAAAVLNVFAPRNPAEMRRVLHPEGRAVVVVPEPEHLRELIEGFGLLSVDARKRDRIEAQFAGRLAVEAEHTYSARLRLNGPQVAQVIGMGPNAWHAAAGLLEAAADDAMDATVAVRAYVLRRA